MGREENSNFIKRISLSGLLLALTVIILILSNVTPINELSLFVVSSFAVSIIIMEFGLKAGWIFYGASCILAMLLVPDKLGVVPYIGFFGVYGIVKFLIEKLRNLILEYILKLAFFNALFFVGFYLASNLILGLIPEKLIKMKEFWVIVLLLEAAFLVYDYAYTQFIVFYINKLKKKLVK